MAATVKYSEVEVGTEIPAVSYDVRRLNLVMYAGASGDFNPIHWDEHFAKSVGLPDVIAHGMFTMAQGGRFVTDWVGDPGAVLDYGVRFSGMVPVAHDSGNTLVISGVVEEKLDDNKVVVGLTARAADQKVLSQAKAVVRLA
ncbi:MaoC family dehydratase [Actinocorallia sp. API 0066]|uniref:MaoC family dehydratase n=1 Tax=Actinocorallia sp. API 0066 TaxID=2896846 RepID=UPI001E503DC9|nr:MaoC family dehydratase [Actinocorallia sp. API 0066]MCD0450289.1 MaoC family dehydratase [Actinocorallia sp. API 0066]